MDGSTIPYYVVEERKKLNRCIEEAPNDMKRKYTGQSAICRFHMKN